MVAEGIPAAGSASRRFRNVLIGAVRPAWRALPRGWRQDLFAALTERGLPPASGGTAASVRLPIVVVGPLSAPTGIGQAARLALHALRAAGVPFASIDLAGRLMQPQTETFPEGTAGPGEGTLLVYVTPPNCGHALRAIPAEIRRGKTVVAGWVCETTCLPPMWRRQASLFDIVAAPSRFAADAIGAAVERPVRVVGHPVEAEPLPPVPVKPRGRTVRHIGAVMDVGSSGDRKNVEALIVCIEAILARSRDVEFHLKVRDLRSDNSVASSFERLLDRAPERVHLARGDDLREETTAFIDRLDLLLSLSRAEGFALPYAEAIMRGVRVAAPRWGGPAEYLDDDNSIALPFRLVPIRDRAGLYGADMGEWAEIDPLAAADLVLAHLNDLRPVRTELPSLCRTDFFIRSLGLPEAITRLDGCAPPDPERAI